MDPAADRRRRRLLIIAVAGGLALLILVGVGIYGLLRGPARDDPRSSDAPTPAVTIPPAPTVGASSAAVPRTGGPEAFARNVAEALFAWDTASGFGPSDYAQMLADVAADEEADALVGDVRAYLPTSEAWAQLRQYATRQWLTIDSAVIPEAWATAEEQAVPGQLPRGATAYTITGTRHRSGIWGTEPVEASRPVTFTVFIACVPPAPEFRANLCRLVRLSELDNPLR